MAPSDEFGVRVCRADHDVACSLRPAHGRCGELVFQSRPALYQVGWPDGAAERRPCGGGLRASCGRWDEGGLLLVAGRHW